jgi:hypothetical protein
MPAKKRINILNIRFGRLVVIEEIGQGANYDRLFLCLCDCGNKKVYSMADLRKGHVQSCGCINQENLLKMNEDNELLRVDGIQPLALIRKTPVHNKSTGVKGVSAEYTKKGTKIYRAYISVGGKKHRLGNWESLEDAIKARKKGEEEYHEPILQRANLDKGELQL